MSGITFLGTNDLPAIRTFYQEWVGMEVWLEQADCIIFRHGNLLLGFCQRTEVQKGGIITIWYRTSEEVDEAFARIGQGSDESPKMNPKYDVYHFFTTDPEDRSIEFQAFLHPTPAFIDGMDLLATRRSIRKFTDEPVSDEVLASIFESCRFSPTSMNSESHYFIIIRDRAILEFISATRGSSSAPIAHSSFAVDICADSSKTKRPVQDGCIAAYHFLVACWTQGVGTCWIAAMDRDDVKERLGVPRDHYIATITPVGFPISVPPLPRRRGRSDLVRTIG
jgi:nitroreductase